MVRLLGVGGGALSMAVLWPAHLLSVLCGAEIDLKRYETRAVGGLHANGVELAHRRA
jgi:hypothetical protein